jgi:hypothetical protein
MRAGNHNGCVIISKLDEPYSEGGEYYCAGYTGYKSNSGITHGVSVGLMATDLYP